MKIIALVIIWIIIAAILLGLMIRVPMDSKERKRQDEEQLKFIREYNKKREQELTR